MTRRGNQNYAGDTAAKLPSPASARQAPPGYRVVHVCGDPESDYQFIRGLVLANPQALAGCIVVALDDSTLTHPAIDRQELQAS